MRKATTPDFDELDLRGLRCPLPALRTERRLEAMEPGATLAVLADDPLARLDIAHLCARKNHALLAVETEGDHLRFLVRRG